MNVRYHARAAAALAAAYVVALQAILLAFSAPGAGAVAALSICASAVPGHSAPIGHAPIEHGQDCLDACLTGCCCGAPILPAPTGAAGYVPAPLYTLAAAHNASAPFFASPTNAHRSRAPPVA
jgi:hypothetical protein